MVTVRSRCEAVGLRVEDHEVTDRRVPATVCALSVCGPLPARMALTIIGMDMRLEPVGIPVSDVDRAKAFYLKAGFVADHDHTVSGEVRFVQMTRRDRRARSRSARD